MRSFISGQPPIYVDMSDLQSKIEHLRLVLTKEQFEKVMYRTFGEVGRRAKTLIAKEVVQDYAVTQKWVKDNTGSYQLTMGGEFPVTCTIPLKGHKGSIGGRFRVGGSAYNTNPSGTWGMKQAPHGYGPPHYWKMRGSSKIKAKIVKATTSTLPDEMKRQGGNPPFLAEGVAFTRRTKKRLPIVRVVGLGVPQMPLNRSAEKVQDALLDYAGQRLEHHFQRMIRGNW